MNKLDKLLVCEAISQLSIREQNKAQQILAALEGTSVCRAEDVLDACKAALKELQINY